VLYPQEDVVEPVALQQPFSQKFSGDPQKQLKSYDVQDTLLRLSQKTNMRAKSALEAFQLFKKNDSG